MAAHKHAEFIKAWAYGKDIEMFHNGLGRWIDVGKARTPEFFVDTEYRIKPAEPERAAITSKMCDRDLCEAAQNAKHPAIGYRAVADAAIQHALDAGQIVTREEFDRAVGDRKKRDLEIAKAAIKICRDQVIGYYSDNGMETAQENHRRISKVNAELIIASVKP